MFLLEFREARPPLKKVVKRFLAVSKSLLRELSINFFQPLEARLVLKLGQFGRKLRPRDRFAGLFVSLFSTRQRPVKDKPARGRITRERCLLFSGRFNSELVNLSFSHFDGKWNLNDVIRLNRRALCHSGEEASKTRCLTLPKPSTRIFRHMRNVHCRYTVSINVGAPCAMDGANLEVVNKS